MAYRIDYDTQTCSKRKLGRKVRGKRWILGVLCLTGVVLLATVPQIRWGIRNLLLPGNEDVTAAALSELVEDLSDGEGFSDSVEAFCKTVLSERDA